MATLYAGYSAAADITPSDLASLPNTGVSSAGLEQNNTTTRYISAQLTFSLTGSAGSTGTVDVYILHGNVTGAEADALNKTILGSITLNSATAVKKTLTFDFETVSAFWKLYIVNNSGGNLAATGNSVTVVGYNPTDV